MKKTRMLLNGKEYVSIPEYLNLEGCPWAHRKTIEKKIHAEAFPALKRGGQWWIDVSGASLWHKRRDNIAS